ARLEQDGAARAGAGAAGRRTAAAGVDHAAELYGDRRVRRDLQRAAAGARRTARAVAAQAAAGAAAQVGQRHAVGRAGPARARVDRRAAGAAGGRMAGAAAAAFGGEREDGAVAAVAGAGGGSSAAGAGGGADRLDVNDVADVDALGDDDEPARAADLHFLVDGPFADGHDREG